MELKCWLMLWWGLHEGCSLRVGIVKEATGKKGICRWGDPRFKHSCQFLLMTKCGLCGSEFGSGFFRLEQVLQARGQTDAT